MTVDLLGYGSICVNYNYVSEVAHINFVCDYEVQASYKGHKQALLVLSSSIAQLYSLHDMHNALHMTFQQLCSRSQHHHSLMYVLSATPYPNIPLPS